MKIEINSVAELKELFNLFKGNEMGVLAALEPAKVVNKPTKVSPVNSNNHERTTPEGLVKAGFVAKYRNVTSATIRIWAKEGMPHEQIDGKYFFDYDKCVTWIDANKSKSIPHQGVKHRRKTPFGEFQSNVFAKIKAQNKDNGKICSEVFRYMTKNYGVVWDQVKKDYYKANNSSATSTLMAAWWLQNYGGKEYRCLFDNCLDTVLKGKN